MSKLLPIKIGELKRQKNKTIKLLLDRRAN